MFINMSKRTTYLLGMAVTIIIGTFLYLKFCCKCCDAPKQIVTATIPENSVPQANSNFELKNNEIDFTCNQNFKFLKNNSQNILPVSDSVNLGIKNLKILFDKNPNQKLVITGYAKNTEINTSAFPNLGEARANSIKNYFISKGFAAEQFDCKGEILKDWNTNLDTILGPAKFKIQQMDATTPQIDWASVKEKINANPLILYFNTNQSEINLTPEERQKVSDLVHYLDNVPAAKLNVVGHSDNVGDRNLNIKLGLERANFAKDYLVKNNVFANKIETSSKGPDEPIADNKTATGRSKNRRTVIKIK
jgi:OmpA-OmpF porin, OOP family